MNTPGTSAQGGGALELPPFSLDVQALDLGSDVKAVGCELVETENREPVRGKEGAEIWSAIFLALAGSESYVVDFFSHVDRVREFCKSRGIALREAAERCVVLPQPNQAELRQLFERFEGETFGIRMRRLKRTYRNVDWTLTSSPTSAIRFARYASRKMAG